MIANTHAQMYEMAVKNYGQIVSTRKGGWGLQVESQHGGFVLMRYHHRMLAGRFATKEIFTNYRDMLKTDLEGVNRFLEHFGFPGRMQPGDRSTYSIPVEVITK